MLEIVLSFVTAFSLTYFAIPPIISIALEKNLCDEPVERSSHKIRTPSLGGIAIFAGIIFSIVLWTPLQEFGRLQYILCSFIIIFLIGAKDDIAPVAPSKKIIAQFLAASILTLKSDIQLVSLYGLGGYSETLPFGVSVVLSIFTILVIMNAFNLIDGINGLAGSLAVLICGTMGVWFYLSNQLEFAILAFTTVGAVLAFLRYNFTPARIFMGDTGSLILGMICAILTVKFIDFNESINSEMSYHFRAAPVVAIGLMIIPLFDTLRVFITRGLRGKSPFEPDRRHIHHLLIDYGCSHMQATGVLIFANSFFIVIVFSLDAYLNLHILLILLLIIAGVLTFYLNRSVLQKSQMTKLLD